MSKKNDEMNVVSSAEQNVNDNLQPVETEAEKVWDSERNVQVAASLAQQNADRAREIAKERLARMTPEQIEALRNAKAAKIEAQKAEAEAPEVKAEPKEMTEEERAALKERLAQMSPEQIEAVRAAKIAKEEAQKAVAAEAAVKATASVATDVKAPAKKKKKRRRGISYESRQSFTGFMFVLPWFLGFLLFFAAPCFQSLRFSFSKVAVFNQFACTPVGFSNFKEILASEATFAQALVSTLEDLAVNVPVVLIFSLFVAVLLNRKFPGRGLVRGIFFLPVIVTTGVVMSTFSMSDSDAAFSGNMNSGILFEVTDASQFLYSLGLNETITDYMSMVADRIFDVVWDSGVQILLFLAALQGISPQLYEASSVEGATAWETFWLITFPNVAPIILVNIVYTIVNTYNDTENKVLQQIETLMTVTFNFGGAAAASWTFFLIILALLGLIFLVYSLLTKNSQ
ncbi:MAG: ABC transporter permease subunit [Clostridia bacterium]|nr:ABC transporter permease subunit [Clostridia bacterium]